MESALEMVCGEIRLMRDQLDELSNWIKQLVAQKTVKDHYTPKEFAEIVCLSVDQVRDHLRNRRIHGEHRPGTGRGNKPEWRIPQDELLRYQNEGLRPKPKFAD